jgi:hypothetical protein
LQELPFGWHKGKPQELDEIKENHRNWMRKSDTKETFHEVQPFHRNFYRNSKNLIIYFGKGLHGKKIPIGFKSSKISPIFFFFFQKRPN